jgi:hypothetical protein
MAPISLRPVLKTNHVPATAVILAIPVVLAGLAAAQDTEGEVSPGGWCQLFSNKTRPMLL